MERRKKRRDAGGAGSDHPLAPAAKLRPHGPALERRRTSRTSPAEHARVTLQLPHDLVERLRNAVFWTPGLTLTALANEALHRLMEEIESEHGGAFPQRKQKLRLGRPVK